MQYMESESSRSDHIELCATAQEAIERTEHIVLSERDSLRVFELLENPPQANTKLIATVKAWQDNQKKLDIQ